VSGDGSLAHYFQPEKKRMGKEWQSPNSPKTKEYCAQPAAGKVMLALFWDSNGPILEHYMSRGTTITSSSYCDLLVNDLKTSNSI
jgi:Transposase.